MLIVNAGLVVFVTLQRLFELALSKRNQRRLREHGIEPGPDPVFGAMVAAHVLLLAGSALEPWLFERPFHPWLGGPALTVFLLAQLGRVWVVRSLGEHWNVRIFQSGERGVVTSGPYRWIRHPNYVVVWIEALTLPLIHSAWWTWILVQVLHTPVLAKRIRDEETALLSNPVYRAAMGHKPRFLPRLFRTA